MWNRPEVRCGGPVQARQCVTFATAFEMIRMKDLLKAYENRAPDIVFAWQDSETEARGWVVINSLRGGAAGGGTRMRAGLDQREVESLAKTMEVKFTVSGPHMGGARAALILIHQIRERRVFWKGGTRPLPRCSSTTMEQAET